MDPSVIIIGFLLLLIVNHRYYWKVNSQLKFKDPTPFFISHRGYKSNYPENTIESYKAAEESGFKWVELDVVTTNDGHILCTHNFDLERETNGLGYFHKINKRDVNPVNVVDKNRIVTGSRVPSLISVFNELHHNTKVNIEIKAPRAFDFSTARALIRVLPDLPIERILVSSFNPFVIAYLRLKNKRLITGFLYQNLEYEWLINWIHPSYIHPRADLIDESILKYKNERNLGIAAWTVNNRPAIDWCLRKNLDAIITDSRINNDQAD